MLALVFATFTICYLSRTLYDIFVGAGLEFSKLFSGVCLPLLWDGLPIFLMFAYHYKNLKMLETEKR